MGPIIPYFLLLNINQILQSCTNKPFPFVNSNSQSALCCCKPAQGLSGLWDYLVARSCKRQAVGESLSLVKLHEGEQVWEGPGRVHVEIPLGIAQDLVVPNQ